MKWIMRIIDGCQGAIYDVIFMPSMAYVGTLGVFGVVSIGLVIIAFFVNIDLFGYLYLGVIPFETDWSIAKELLVEGTHYYVLVQIYRFLPLVMFVIGYLKLAKIGTASIFALEIGTLIVLTVNLYSELFASSWGFFEFLVFIFSVPLIITLFISITFIPSFLGPIAMFLGLKAREMMESAS